MARQRKRLGSASAVWPKAGRLVGHAKTAPRKSRVSYSHEYVFVHVARTAGQSICAVLSERYGATTWNYWIDYRGLNKAMRQWYTFAVYRNPYSRAVSLWRFRRQLKHPSLKEIGSDTFADWIRWACEHGLELGSQAEYLAPVRLDAILRYESLPSELQRLPFWQGSTLPHMHRTAARLDEWRQYVTPTTAKLVQRWAGADFDAFGYPLRLSAYRKR